MFYLIRTSSEEVYKIDRREPSLYDLWKGAVTMLIMFNVESKNYYYTL